MRCPAAQLRRACRLLRGRLPRPAALLTNCPAAQPHRASRAHAARLRRGACAPARDALWRHGTALLLPGEAQRRDGSAAASRRGELDAAPLALTSSPSQPPSDSSLPAPGYPCARSGWSTVRTDPEGVVSSSPSLMSDSPPPRVTTPTPLEARAGRRLHRAKIGSGIDSTGPYRSNRRALTRCAIWPSKDLVMSILEMLLELCQLQTYCKPSSKGDPAQCTAQTTRASASSNLMRGRDRGAHRHGRGAADAGGRQHVRVAQLLRDQRGGQGRV